MASPSSSEMISVSFRSLDGKRVTLEVPSDIEIAELKELLSQEFNVAPDQQRLIYRGRAIQPTGILGDYVKESGHTIHVVFRQTDSEGSSTPQLRETPSATQSTTPPQSQPGQTSATTRTTQSTTTSGHPGMMMGSVHIEHGSSNNGEPQVTIRSDIPINGQRTIMDSLMSSIAGLARAPGVQVTASADGFPFGTPFPPMFAPPTSTQQPSQQHQPPTSTTGQQQPSAENLVQQLMMGAMDPTRRFTAGGTFAFPTGTARFGGSPGFMTAAVPMAHAQQHAEAVARAAAQHHAAVAASHARASTGTNATPATTTPPTETPIRPEADEQPAAVSEAESVTSKDQSAAEEATADSAVSNLEATEPSVAATQPQEEWQTQRQVPTAASTPEPQPTSQPGQPRTATTSTTQTSTFLHGIPMSMMTTGATTGGQSQSPAVHVAVGALPIGEGTNWAQLLGQMMGGQFGPTAVVQSTIPSTSAPQQQPGQPQQPEQQPGQQQQPGLQQQQHPRPMTMHDFIHAASHGRGVAASGQTATGVPYAGVTMPLSQPIGEGATTTATPATGAGLPDPIAFLSGLSPEFGELFGRAMRPTGVPPRDTSQEDANNNDVTADLQTFLSLIATTLGAARRSLASSEETLLHCLDEQRQSAPPSNAPTPTPMEVDAIQSPSEAAPSPPEQLSASTEGPTSQPLGQPPSSASTATPIRPAPLSHRRRGSTLWISNEYIAERLPWNTLNELATVLRRATGWQMPPISARISPSSPSPLTTFLLTYQQLQGVASSLMSQLQAWQTGTGGMAVTTVGQAVNVLALTASIDSSLASLLSWLFVNMARQVGPNSLNDLLPPSRRSRREHPSVGGSPRNPFGDSDHDDDDDEFKDVDEASSGHRRSFGEQHHEMGHHEMGHHEMHGEDDHEMDVASDVNESSEGHLSAKSRKRSTERNTNDDDASSIREERMDCSADAKKRRMSEGSRKSGKEENSIVDVTEEDNDEEMVEVVGQQNVVGREPVEVREHISGRLSHSVPSSTNSLISNQSTTRMNPFEQLLGGAAGANPLANMMSSLLNGPLMEQSSTQQTRDTGVSRLPHQVRDRYQTWTGNPVDFSRSVLSQAKNSRPLSNAYISGDPTQSASDRRNHELPAVGTIFGLTWRHSASRLNIPDESGGDVPHRLTRPYIATMLQEISNQVRQHRDFQAIDPTRFPNLHELLRLQQNRRS